jgi:glycosyltransferase involved in cell wall biosynthesis
MKLSIAIISHNEEHNLARTLDSVVPIADEIVIVDSYSTDKTLEIAQRYNARIFQKEWNGFSEQKNALLEKCNGEWILFLDCDEVLSKELIESIKKILINSEYDGYSINRKTFYIDKIMKYAWQPDLNLRLVKSSANPKWKGGEIHEFLTIEGSSGIIAGEIIHYSYKDMKQHFEKTISYAKISAESYYKKGKKFSFLNILLNPIIAFIRLYFINKGIFDGVYGFIAAMSSMIGTFLKYAFLWELEKNNSKQL